MERGRPLGRHLHPLHAVQRDRRGPVDDGHRQRQGVRQQVRAEELAARRRRRLRPGLDPLLRVAHPQEGQQHHLHLLPAGRQVQRPAGPALDQEGPGHQLTGPGRGRAVRAR
ncbi:hypothetical protein SGPA1_50648 [Streptomyces misionensis JCM 4497]